MELLSQFPFFPVEFDKSAKLVKSQQVDDLKAALRGGTTDLIVISHGWNNDIADAKDLYARFLATARQLIDAGQLASAAGRQFAVLGVHWPSKKFAERDLIPGGAAGVEGVDAAALKDNLRELAGVFDAADADETLAKLTALVPRLEDSDQACADFVSLARGLMPQAAATDGADGSDLFFALPPEEVFAKLKQPVSYSSVAAPGAEIGRAHV